MKFKIHIHPAEEGGYWAEVPALPGCLTQGETIDELLANAEEAIHVFLVGSGMVETEACIRVEEVEVL